MDDDALSATLAGAASLRRAGHAAAPRGGSRRLTADAFRALTRRLKGLEEVRRIPPLFEPSGVADTSAADGMPALPETVLDGGETMAGSEETVPSSQSPPESDEGVLTASDSDVVDAHIEAPDRPPPASGEPDLAAWASPVEEEIVDEAPAAALTESLPLPDDAGKEPGGEPPAAAAVGEDPGPPADVTGIGHETKGAEAGAGSADPAADGGEAWAATSEAFTVDPAKFETAPSDAEVPAMLEGLSLEVTGEQEAGPQDSGESLDVAEGALVGREVVATDEGSAVTSRMLLDIMSMSPAALQPQERALAADTLLRLIARMPVNSVMALAERICLMEVPPGLIVKELINHADRDVAAVVLEKCAGVTDQDLLELVAGGDLAKLRMVARRRQVSSALVDALIARGDTSVFLTIVRNPGADISHEAFIELCDLAKTHPSLQAPLATRVNTPAPVAFELFWYLPSELRRYVLSRFLTDSETLDRILKITMAVDASPANQVTEKKFPERARVEELVGLLEEGLTLEASRLMAGLSGICEASARRLIADPDGEPLTVAMKAMGATRALFSSALERWRNSTSAMLRADRNLDELRTLFDSMSFNKARVLLTYWDWAARKAGPYARGAT